MGLTDGDVPEATGFLPLEQEIRIAHIKGKNITPQNLKQCIAISSQSFQAGK